jgi:sulfide:quinone oxidoreductase
VQKVRKRPHVVIAGGGVAGVEALLALRALAGPGPSIELISPEPDLVYRPLRVAEPFDLGEARRFPLEDIVSDQRASLRSNALTSVDPAGHRARLSRGEWLAYDTLLVATGARASNALPHALPFHGHSGSDELAATLERAGEKGVRRLVFAVPEGVSWPLPLYELALLTAWRLERHAVKNVTLRFVTPEQEPLDLFGAEAAARVRTLLEERGIELMTGASPIEAGRGRVVLANGPSVPADRTITVPGLEGPRISGLPADSAGFIPADAHGRVKGVEGVYVAGDGADYPVKQGGLATQQADAAAEAIAAAMGSPQAPQPFRPVLRAVLLTGSTPLYLRAHLDDTEAPAPEVAQHSLWWPPGKIAGRYLSPYLVTLERPAREPPPFEDRELAAGGERVDAAEHDAALQLALMMADDEAQSGSTWRALEWLEAAETLNGVLPPEYVDKRRRWRFVRERAATRRRAEQNPDLV